MRLSRRQRELLHDVQLDAEVPIAKLARRLRMKEHTVRYDLMRLEEQGVARRYPFINIYPLGFEETAIYFSAASPAGRRRKLIAALERMDRISWILELAGEHHFAVGVCTQGSGEIAELLDDLSERFGDIFFEKRLAIRTGWHLFSRKYLAPGRAPGKPLSCGRTGEAVSLDELDHRILLTMSNSTGATLRELARTLGSPPATVGYRVRALRESGVLRGFAYGVDARTFGMQPYRLLVYLKQVSLRVKRDFYSFCADDPQIFALIECLGSWDFEVKAEIEQPTELIALLDRMYAAFGGAIQSISVLNVLGTRKLQFYPFQRNPSTTRAGATHRAQLPPPVAHFD